MRHGQGTRLCARPTTPRPDPQKRAFRQQGQRGVLRLIEPQARAAGVALLVPESRGPTWDVIMGGFGPDVTCLDAALQETFAQVRADPARLAIGGFSDGASYALSLGLANGDLFR